MGDSQIVVLGAGRGGTIAAYEIRAARTGKAKPFYEALALHVLGVKKRHLGTGARP